MVTHLLISMLVAGANPGPSVVAQQANPAVQVWLNDNRLARGDQGRVYVRAARDGYVLVLHAEPEGRVRVLFPLDPTDDNYVRGGKTYEVRGRGNRDAFTAWDGGTGTIVAAYSRDPYQFTSYTVNDHWDYRLDVFASTTDPEADLTGIVQGIVGPAGFDYDLTQYDVTTYVASAENYAYPLSIYSGYYYPRSGLHISLSFGAGPYWYASPWRYYYDPWYYDPFYYPYAPVCGGWLWCSGYWYRPYYYSYYYRPYYYAYNPYYRSYYYRAGFPYRYGTRSYGFYPVQPRGGAGAYTFKSPGGAVARGVVNPRSRVPAAGATSGRVLAPPSRGPAAGAGARAGVSQPRAPSAGRRPVAPAPRASGTAGRRVPRDGSTVLPAPRGGSTVRPAPRSGSTTGPAPRATPGRRSIQELPPARSPPSARQPSIDHNPTSRTMRVVPFRGARAVPDAAPPPQRSPDSRGTVVVPQGRRVEPRFAPRGSAAPSSARPGAPLSSPRPSAPRFSAPPSSGPRLSAPRPSGGASRVAPSRGSVRAAASPRGRSPSAGGRASGRRHP